MKTLRKTQAALIIEEHFQSLKGRRDGDDVLVSARAAGRRMVEIYRLLTGEMPQSGGVEAEFRGDELPGVEFPSPLERDPNEIFYVYPGPPDVLVSGDQNDRELEVEERGIQPKLRAIKPPRD